MELMSGGGLQCLSGCKVKRRSFLARVCGVCSAGGCLSRSARLSHGKVAERPAAALTLGRRGHRRGAQPFKPAHTHTHTSIPPHTCVFVCVPVCVCVQVLECHLCFSNCLAPVMKLLTGQNSWRLCLRDATVFFFRIRRTNIRDFVLEQVWNPNLHLPQRATWVWSC